MFLLPNAMAASADARGAGWAASLTMGATQFYTNQGIAVVINGPNAIRFIAAVKSALEKCARQMMLTPGMAAAHQSGAALLQKLTV